jgi:hypothetical protein
MSDIKELDEYFAAFIKKHCHTDDTEMDHANADEKIIELLEKLECVKTVEQWRLVKKWYA